MPSCGSAWDTAGRAHRGGAMKSPAPIPSRDDRNTRTPTKIVQFDGSTDHDVLAISGDGPPLLECREVEAICRSVTQTYFGPFKQHKLVFNFSVLMPEEYAAQKLEMFVRIDRHWKTPPSASKLLKIGCIAEGRRLRKGDRITTAMFIN